MLAGVEEGNLAEERRSCTAVCSGCMWHSPLPCRCCLFPTEEFSRKPKSIIKYFPPSLKLHLCSVFALQTSHQTPLAGGWIPSPGEFSCCLVPVLMVLLILMVPLWVTIKRTLILSMWQTPGCLAGYPFPAFPEPLWFASDELFCRPSRLTFKSLHRGGWFLVILWNGGRIQINQGRHQSQG